MSTRESILRYFHITNRLRKSAATFEEIDSYLRQQSEFQGCNFNISKRQFNTINTKTFKNISSKNIRKRLTIFYLYCNFVNSWQY